MPVIKSLILNENICKNKIEENRLSLTPTNKHCKKGTFSIKSKNKLIGPTKNTLPTLFLKDVFFKRITLTNMLQKYKILPMQHIHI